MCGDHTGKDLSGRDLSAGNRKALGLISEPKEAKLTDADLSGGSFESALMAGAELRSQFIGASLPT